MHFQMFIPGGNTANALVDLGLADFVGGAEHLPSQGPEGLSGLLLAWRKPGKNQRMHFNAKEQTWIPSLTSKTDEDKPAFWIGFWNDSTVTPADLLRPYSHPGKSIELGDGNSWRFPRIQSLPRDMVLADDGTWKFQLQRDYHDLWMESEELLKKIIAVETHDFSQLTDFCCRCLRQNYRILPEVVSHLKLINTTNVQLAICGLLDLEPSNGE